MRFLLLFDVDGTLIRRGDPDHLAAMDYGVRTAFPEAGSASIHSVEFDGKVDRVIASEVLAQADVRVDPSDSRLDRIFDLAGDYYRRQWQGRQSGGSDDLLPGVAALVRELAEEPETYALGVVTGGSREIVAVKLTRLGLVESFPVGSFGNEVPNRPALVPLALERASEYFGDVFEPEQVVIVGDTPSDVHCAHVHSIPCLGVATGKYSEEDLSRVGADLVMRDLADIERVRDALLTVSFASR